MLVHLHLSTFDTITLPDVLSTYERQMYDAALERYIPVLMAMARIYWDRENYPIVEKLFRQAAEFCSDHDTWKLNAAHVFFMEEKFKVPCCLFYSGYIA